jgi:uncharacterized membrane protein
MELSPEERRKIYEEEKARIAAEQKQRVTGGQSSTGLEPNVAGLLCYLGFWVTGIVFLVIEQRNRFVRFHALQSIVTFGALTIIGALIGWIRYVGVIFGPIIGVLVLVLWIIMMVRAHEGEMYRLPLAGQVAEEMLPAEWRTGRPGTGPEQETGQTAATVNADILEREEARSGPVSQKENRDNVGIAARGRVAGYGIAIAFNVILLVFFSFFHGYVAYYTNVDGVIIRLPLLTDAYFTFLPMLVTALVITIGAYILLIAYDRYWLREGVQIVLAAIGVAVLVNLIAIFPFDFSVIPDSHVASIMPAVVTIVLVVVAVGLGISALVRLIRLMIGVTR